jgi:hypothetical protein
MICPLHLEAQQQDCNDTQAWSKRDVSTRAQMLTSSKWMVSFLLVLELPIFFSRLGTRLQESTGPASKGLGSRAPGVWERGG